MDSVLLNHIDSIENKLLAEFNATTAAGHPLHKGTPREIFIKDFLKNHIGQNLAIGAGEIIDCNSKIKEKRNQFDIVIYKNNFPKLHFASDINAFLIESVIATIEVKSMLNKAGLKRAIVASINSKKLTRNTQASFTAGFIPPSITNLLVAYDGPKEMSKILTWMDEIYKELGLNDNRKYATDKERAQIPSLSIDGIIILKKGVIFFDNMPMSFRNEQNINEQNKSRVDWIHFDSENGNLLVLFLIIIQITQNIAGIWLNVMPYIKEFRTNATRSHFI